MENKLKNWDLSELYPSFESGEFQNDIAELSDKTEEIKRFWDGREADAKSPENAAAIIKEFTELLTAHGQKAARLCDFCELTLSTDADNRTALNCLERLEDILTETTAAETRFSLFIKGMDDSVLDRAIEAGEALSEYTFFIREIKRNSQYTLSAEEERVISKMRNTGSAAWVKYQDNIMANLTADINIGGEPQRLPFAEIRNLAYDKRADTRKAAYEAELAACRDVAGACASALSAIKGEALTVLGMRGYASPLEASVLDARLDMRAFEALLGSIRKNAVIFAPYFKKKAEMLGHTGGLPFYDLFAPIGEDLSFSYDEAVDFVCENLRDFSVPLGDYARRAADSSWLDVYPKAGKRGGAFCQNMHYLKQSRFLLNFKGSFNDVLTLAHELGHGYHGDCLKDEAFLNSEYPMPIAETASTLCETIVINAALKSAGGGAALSILENGISGAAQVIIDILSRFIFESRTFEERKNGSLSAETLCGFMREAQLYAYGGALSREYAHEYMWVVKSHYYSATLNFYNYPYAFGMLFSNGLYKRFLAEGQSFSEVCRKMLALTGKADLRTVALAAGIDICEESFWDSAFEVVKRDIDRFIAL